MDAVQTFFNKTVLFLATALLLVVPGRAQTFNLGGTATSTASVQLGSQATGVTVVGRLDSSTPITFTTATTDTSANPTGQNWLSVTGTLTTPTTLCFSVARTQGMQNGLTYSATVTLTSTNLTPSTTGTVNVS